MCVSVCLRACLNRRSHLAVLEKRDRFDDPSIEISIDIPVDIFRQTGYSFVKVAPWMLIYGQVVIVCIQLRLDSVADSKVRESVIDERPFFLVPRIDLVHARDEQG